MNARQRRTYWRSWHRFIRIQQEKWLPRVEGALQKQVKEFTDYARQHGLTAAQSQIQTIVTAPPLADVLRSMYVSVGIARANTMEREERTYSQKLLTVGANERLTQIILQYFQQNILNKAVYIVTETTKKQILRVVSAGVALGLGEDEIVRMVTSSEYTPAHARLVVRTESTRAANTGAMLYAKESRLVYDKEWISAHDDRVRRPPKDRFDHWDIDGTIVPYELPFTVSGEQMQFPGDPAGSAGNVCNCRCTAAYRPRRDANGQLIRKPARPQAVISQPWINSAAEVGAGVTGAVIATALGTAIGELFGDLF